MDIPGIILAAGASRRMGSPKALLHLEGRSFVAIAADVLAAAGVHPIVTVTRADLVERVAACVGDRSRVAVNPEPDHGMLSSLLVGLAALEALGARGLAERPWSGFIESERDARAGSILGGTAEGPWSGFIESERDARGEYTVGVAGEGPWPGFVLLLVDQPRVSVEVVRHLAEVFSRSPGRIVLPSQGPQGRGGHPVFFPWACVPELRALPLDQGPNVVVRRDPHRVLRVEVADVACFDDVDTPEDLRRVLSPPSSGASP